MLGMYMYICIHVCVCETVQLVLNEFEGTDFTVHVHVCIHVCVCETMVDVYVCVRTIHSFIQAHTHIIYIYIYIYI